MTAYLNSQSWLVEAPFVAESDWNSNSWLPHCRLTWEFSLVIDMTSSHVWILTQVLFCIMCWLQAYQGPRCRSAIYSSLKLTDEMDRNPKDTILLTDQLSCTDVNKFQKICKAALVLRLDEHSWWGLMIDFARLACVILSFCCRVVRRWAIDELWNWQLLTEIFLKQYFWSVLLLYI
jgi:hypothetical protein